MNIINKKAIVKTGSKEVDTKTQRQEKIYVMTMLWIIAFGTKLFPIWVFKSQPDGRFELSLYKNIAVLTVLREYMNRLIGSCHSSLLER